MFLEAESDRHGDVSRCHPNAPGVLIYSWTVVVAAQGETCGVSTSIAMTYRSPLNTAFEILVKNAKSNDRFSRIFPMYKLAKITGVFVSKYLQYYICTRGNPIPAPPAISPSSIFPHHREVRWEKGL